MIAGAAALALAASLAASALQAQRADTAAVHVRGPTVVACFKPVTQAEADSGSDVAAALDDWQWYWSSTQRTLRDRGVAAEARMARWVKLAYPGRIRLVRCPDVGYVLVSPGRQPKVLRGVETDESLLAIAAAYFRRPSLARKAGGDGRHP